MRTMNWMFVVLQSLMSLFGGATMTGAVFVSASSPTQQAQTFPRRLPAIVSKGYKWFDSETGQEFVVRGIDYFPRPNQGPLNHNSMDLYTEEYRHIWERDIPYLQELGVNAIRLYAVDPTQDHTSFMYV